MSNSTQPLEIGKEYAEPGEEQFLAEMIQEMEDELDRLYTGTKMERQVHTKMHGLLKAEFIVEENIPVECKVGIFKEAQSFPAWIRLSSGHTKPQSDTKKDQRGIAIKLMNVPGKKLLAIAHDTFSQDFILASAPIFFTKNIGDFRKMLKALTSKRKFSVLRFFLTHPRTMFRSMKLVDKCSNLLSLNYYSISPYRCGGENTAVKYSVQPSANNKLAILNTTDYDFLKNNLTATLAENDIYLDFLMQFQTDPVTMPIEDHTVEWKSPFKKVATIRIPRQVFDTEEQNTFGDDMKFNTWHSIAEHQPLGNINRGRKTIYKSMYKYRLGKDNEQLFEPLPGPDFFNDSKPFYKQIQSNVEPISSPNT